MNSDRATAYTCQKMWGLYSDGKFCETKKIDLFIATVPRHAPTPQKHRAALEQKEHTSKSRYMQQ
jgi:hypothetical protein